METLRQIFHHLVSRTQLRFVRYLYSQINWNNRLIGIVGSRGVGKTTMLLQHIRQNYDIATGEVLYASLDNLWFSTHTLVDLADEFYKSGGKVLFLDEVHKYDGWAREIKNIYDSYPELKVVFTGSSMLDIYRSGADLSRRAIKYTLYGMSLREFLLYEHGIKIEPLTLEEVLGMLDARGLCNGIMQKSDEEPLKCTREDHYPLQYNKEEGVTIDHSAAKMCS